MVRDLTQRTNLFLILLAAAICTVFPTSLFAHVALFPQTTQAGARHESFYIRAPVEKDIPVVELGFEVNEVWIENGERSPLSTYPTGNSTWSWTQKNTSRRCTGRPPRKERRPGLSR